MTSTLYGVFTVARIPVALPLSELREVIPCPDRFEPLLAAAPGLVGAVRLRQQVIPVLDLRVILGLDTEHRIDVVVVITYQGAVFGLLACAVRGVVELDDADLLGMSTDDAAPAGPVMFNRSFERPEDGTVVCVLDCAAIRRLPGLPLADDTRAAHTGPSRRGETDSDQRTMMMLLRCGPIGVCVDVNDIHAVIPELTVKSSPLDGDVIRGVIALGDRYVPVVDPLAVLRLGELAPIDAKRGVALAYLRGLVTFAVTEVVRIVSVPASAVLPLPRLGAPDSPHVIGVLPEQEHGSYLVLDGPTLRADPELDSVAVLGTAVPGTASAAPPETNDRRDRHSREADGKFDRRAIEPSVRKFLTYHAGLEVATPLAQISEIVPYPSDIIPFVESGPVRGLFTHRKASVPLVFLPPLLGHPEDLDPESARILLVETDHSYVGFAVPQLRAIEESVWEEKPHPEPPTGDILRDSSLVKIGTAEEGRMIPHIDLKRIPVG